MTNKKENKMFSGKTKFTKSCGNVFEDLGFDKEEAAIMMFKAQIAVELMAIRKRRKMNQTNFAALLETTQPYVSDYESGRMKRLSVEKLLTFLIRLDRNLTMKSKDAKRSGKKHQITYEDYRPAV